MVAEEVQDEEEHIGDVAVAEYVVLLLALSTYLSFLERQGLEGDDLTRKGIALVRLADSHAIRDFFQERLTRPVSKLAVARSFMVRVGNAAQASRRALTIRAALDPGRVGSAVLAAVFDESRARRAMKVSIAAHNLSEPAEAFSDYVTVPLRNSRIKSWIKEVRDTVGAGTVIQNPVERAAAAVADQVQTLKQQELNEEATTVAEDVQDARDQRTGSLDQLQTHATETARAALVDSGEDDSPPTRSEVIGIATAAAAAAASNLDNSGNVPESLRKLDPEQLAAALTDGRVLVAAGAGAGKSTTLVARVRYLVQERKVNPSHILVSSFNKDAADELGHKIGKAVGGGNATAMKIGTLHSVFKSCIEQYGSPAEQAMFPKKKWSKDQKNKKADPILSGSAIAGAVNRIWRKCYAEPDGRGGSIDAEVPQARQMLMAKTRYAGNAITPAVATEQAQGHQEHQEALWYEMYEGLKGSIPGWEPRCNDSPDAMYEYHAFNKKYREKVQGGKAVTVRLGDYDDMISTFVTILKREPAVKKSFQKQYDHILIDECQDLNTVQNEALALMTEHIGRDASDKSFWMIGDDKQSIYDFRGAKPSQFTARANDENTKVRHMRTNYRCPPEVVDAANRLISHNTNQIKMEANPAPGRVRGEASVKASVFADEPATAIAVASEIRELWDDGAPISGNAILCRTNSELHAFETGLLMRGIPYARRGASSFLSAPETKAFMGYISLVTDTDSEKTQSALVDCINKPNRFFLRGGREEVQRGVDNAIHNYARKMRMPKKSVNAFDALRDYHFQLDLLRSFGASERYMQDNLSLLDDLVQSLGRLQEVTDSDSASTKDMFKAVLDMPGVSLAYNKNTGRNDPVRTTFTSEMSIAAKDYGGDGEDDSPPESDKAPRSAPSESEDEEATPDRDLHLGNIGFLYELALPDPEDPADAAIPPTTPKGFWAKMGQLTVKAKELRINLDEWNEKQKDLPPEKREKPPGVYLGTIHSTKGAEWDNVFLQMPAGRFPMIKKRKEGEITEATLLEDAKKMESERRLAYVAMTRPIKNLRIVAPNEYQGKPAGMSQFVDEAGLSLGENVVRPGSETTEPKTAAFFAEDSEYYADMDDLAVSGGYDGW